MLVPYSVRQILQKIQPPLTAPAFGRSGERQLYSQAILVVCEGHYQAE